MVAPARPQEPPTDRVGEAERKARDDKRDEMFVAGCGCGCALAVVAALVALGYTFWHGLKNVLN